MHTQVDLSDDVVITMLFGSSAWQDVMSPVLVREGRERVAGSGH